MEDEVKDVGIVLSGNLLMVQEDFWGKRAILSQIQPSELFADSFCCAHVEHFPVSFVANEASEVMLIDYKKLITSCTSACVFHSGLIKNMLELLARSNLNLTSKIELLTRPSTKEKLLSYLSELSRAKNSESFEVPYNRQELADYLSVDRSAMSNELSKLRAEGILDFERGNFVLLKPFE
jgi:CRP-like cAMP-binding protein